MLKTTKTLPFQLKSACKANGIGGRLVGRGGGGKGKNQTPSNQKGLQDQKASLMKLPKKKDHVRVECMPTYKKVLHAGVQALHSKAHSRHCHPLLHLILGTLTYCQLGLHQHDNFFLSSKINCLYEICLDIVLVPGTKQRLKREKCVYTAKPVKKTLTLNKPG